MVNSQKTISDIRIVPTVESFEWFQTLLSNLEQEVIVTPYDEKMGGGESSLNSQFLRVHNYLTAKLDANTVQNIMINDAGALNDALTGLRSRTKYGRPNWKTMFTEIKEGIERGTYVRGLAGTKCRVGVYFCGPSVIAKALKKECVDASTEFVKCVIRLSPIANDSHAVEGTFLRLCIGYAGRVKHLITRRSISLGIFNFLVPLI
jgi:NADPH oxidase 1